MPEDQEAVAQPQPIRIKDIEEIAMAGALKPLWSNWLFENSIILEVGEPGISKTHFNYGLAKAIVDFEPFLNIRPVRRGLRVLMCDLESGDSLIKSRFEAGIFYPKNIGSFKIFNNPEHTFYDVAPVIEEYMAKNGPFHIIFLDCLRAAFNMIDENDNAEASKQMKKLRYYADRWGCAFVVVHHSSKAEMPGIRKASGAFSRTALADINWNFDQLGEGFDPSVFKFTIPKNRLIDDQCCIFIRKEDRRFTQAPIPAGYTTTNNEDSVSGYRLQNYLSSLLLPNVHKDPRTLLAEVNKIAKKPISRSTIHRRLTNLIAIGLAQRDSRGHYISLNHNDPGIVEVKVEVKADEELT
jgi:hypothetical protein